MTEINFCNTIKIPLFYQFLVSRLKIFATNVHSFSFINFSSFLTIDVLVHQAKVYAPLLAIGAKTQSMKVRPKIHRQTNKQTKTTTLSSFGEFQKSWVEM